MQKEWTKMLDNTVNTAVHCSSISSPNCSIITKISLGRSKILWLKLLFCWDCISSSGADDFRGSAGESISEREGWRTPVGPVCMFGGQGTPRHRHSPSGGARGSPRTGGGREGKLFLPREEGEAPGSQPPASPGRFPTHCHVEDDIRRCKAAPWRTQRSLIRTHNFKDLSVNHITPQAIHQYRDH